ncbi:nucleotidyltransferase-like protein [Oceanobacillus manasiensis]|uniref:nucleotidyltransferase-like protein n=1 Tax=Oceanobacillus manasiensis TaxID=586413 RepID=UPI0005A8C79E|nr:nucleotidyltransferase-like protein [Oceanobacillus manasiensis]
MERYLRPIYQEHASDANTLGIILMERTKPNSPVTDNFDGILLIIVQNAEQKWQAKHYEFEDERSAAVHVVSESVLMEWIDTSGYRRGVEWVIYGRVIFDRNEYVYNLKDQLRDFPSEKRDLRKAIEFGKLVKSFSEAKDLYETNEYKDANSKILYSLHYLARLAVIEKGYYPEVTVWGQVKQIDLEVYKLYEEFIESREEMKKRIQLMLLAMDFVISNRAKTSVKHLLEIMEKREDPWSYAQLKILPETSSYALDLTAIISFMVEKDLLATVKQPTKGIGVYHRTYVVNR